MYKYITFKKNDIQAYLYQLMDARETAAFEKEMNNSRLLQHLVAIRKKEMQSDEQQTQTAAEAADEKWERMEQFIRLLYHNPATTGTPATNLLLLPRSSFCLLTCCLVLFCATIFLLCHYFP